MLFVPGGEGMSNVQIEDIPYSSTNLMTCISKYGVPRVVSATLDVAALALPVSDDGAPQTVDSSENTFVGAAAVVLPTQATISTSSSVAAAPFLGLTGIGARACDDEDRVTANG